MSLTGKPVLWLTAVLALLSPLVAVVLWDRVRGSKWQQVVGRLALLGLGETAALVFAFVALNDYAGFVDSWSQAYHFVTGAFGHEKISASDSATSDQPDPAVSANPSAYADRDFRLGSQQAPAPDGRIWRILGDTPPDKWVDTGVTAVNTFTSGPLSQKLYIYLPPQYFGPNGRKDLPILEAFTSFPGPTDYLVSKVHLVDAVLAGIKSGEITPMVVLMMRPDAAGPVNTACTDVPNGPQTLSFYSKALPTEVRHYFGLNTAPGMTVGYSGGGYCAAKISLTDPADFPAAAEMAGTFHPPTDASTQGTFNDPTVRNQNDLGWRLQNQPLPNASLLLTSGRDDNRTSMGHPVAEQWAKLIHSPMTSEQLVLDGNGHDFGSFERQLPYDLSWLSSRLPGSTVHLAPVPADSSVVPGSNGPAPSALEENRRRVMPA